jgi:ribonucleotide reductase beta subunit family protein with ferritin-like domain
MLTESSGNDFTVHYPEAQEYARKQLSVFWPHWEVDVSKDVQDLRVNLTESEKHGVLTTLKLFTKYEQHVGEDYWLGKVMQWFPRHEVQEMASVFGMFELGIHKRFYKRLNEELGLDTLEFYNSYVSDADLRSRMEFIDSILSGDNKLLSLAVFSMIEGVVLYSSFAFLKHFQAKGKNKIKNVCAGIDFSVRDENLHSEAGAWLYRVHKKERNSMGAYDISVASYVREAAHQIYEHEKIIIHKLFEKGPIEGITETQLIHFVEHRINMCLKNLELEPMFEVTYNPIKDWFYTNINSFKSADFFNKQGASYNRNWKEGAFVW